MQTKFNQFSNFNFNFYSIKNYLELIISNSFKNHSFNVRTLKKIIIILKYIITHCDLEEPSLKNKGIPI